MTKLISGRVAKVNSANVSADRYDFLSLDEAEPDLGLPAVAGQVLTSNVTGTRSWLTLNTTNVVEAINLYYTNARVITAVTPLLTTANVVENYNNLYFTNARVVSALVAGQNITIEANGRISASVSANVSPTDIRNALSNATIPGNLTVTGTITSNGLTVNGIEVITGGANESNLVVTRITANVWNNLYTTNVIERAGNLYFTNARVVSALIAGQNITIEANGRISATTSNTSSIIASLTDSIVQGNLTITGTFRSNGLIVNGVEVVTGGSNEANISAAKLTANLIVLQGNTLFFNYGANTGAAIGHNSNTDVFTFNKALEINGNLKVGVGIGGNILGVNYMTAENFVANTTTANNMVIYGNVVVGTGTGGTITDAYLISASYFVANVMYANAIYTNSIVVNGLEIVSGTTNEANIVVARVTANIITTNTIIINGTEFVTGTSGEANLAVTKITANIIFANNFILNGVPLSNLQSQVNNLTTDNVSEGTNNLYYTNSRARTAYTAGQNITIAANGQISASTSAILGSLAEANIQGNLRVTGTVTANGFVSTGVGVPTLTSASNINIVASNGDVNITAKNLRVAGNLIVTNSITANAITINGIEIVTGGTGEANIAATRINTHIISANVWNNLYTSNIIDNLNVFSNTSAITTTITPYLTTANVIELPGNLYYTNSRVLSAVNPLLTTANVIESPNNLYYTNSRVRSTLSGGTGVTYDSSAGTIAIGQDVSTTSDVLFRNVSLTGNLYVLGNLVSVFANTLTVSDPIIQLGFGNPGDNYDLGFIGHYYDGATERHAGVFRDHTDGKFKFFDNLTSEPALNDIDTANVTFRYAAVKASTFEGNVLGIVSSLANHTTSNLIEGINQYFTNVRVLQAVNPLLTAANIVNFISTVNSTVQPFLTTANVIETSGNLYFTNSRVVSALTAGDNIIIEANGRISANITTTIANLSAQINNLTTDQITEGAINLYYTNSRVRSAFTAGDNIIIESNGRISANVTTSIANLQSQITNLTTDQINEGAINQYFTNARAVIAITSSGTLTTSNVNEGSNLYFTDARAITAVNPRLTTANVIEAPNFVGFVNLYYTNARAVATVTPLLTTANVIEDASNLYFTNARVVSGLVNSNIQIENLYANSTIYANALIIRNISVTDTVLLGSNVSGGAFSGNSLVVESVTANVWNNLYTANVIETSGNLYFTNARVVSALTAGQNITIEGNGRISANVSGIITAGENVTVEANGRISVTLIPVTTVNDSARFISTGATTYTMGTSVNDPKNVLVIVEGLVQIPVVDYTVSGTSLILADAPIVGSNIEVRYFGVDTINSARALSATVDTFIGNGTNVVYTLSSTPPNKNFVTIMIDGIYQQSDVYTLSGKNITFPEAPSLGSNIDIRVIGGAAGSTYNTRTFTANGNVSSFALTEGFTRDTILVFENGVAQMPLVDYDVVNDYLVFTTPPAANVVVQVREMGISGISAANVIAAIRSLDQVTGNLVPTTNATKDLGSSSKTFKNLYLNQNGLVLSNVIIGATETAITLTSSSNVTTTITSTQTLSSRSFGLSLIFGG